MHLTIGCTTRPYAAWPFAEACRHIAAAGYTDVAVFGNRGRIAVQSDSTQKEIAEARKAATDAGLEPSMLLGATRLDLGLASAVEEYNRLIDNAASLGATWLLDGGTEDESLFEDYYELMRRVARHAREAGVKITMKPHGGIGLTPQDLMRAYRAVGHPSFGICYDPGNIIYYTKGQVRPEKGIRQIAPMVTTGIIKDCVVTDGVPDVMVTPGEGLVDFPKVLAGLVWGGFKGPLYVECVSGKEIEEIDRNVKATLSFVRDILGGL